MCRDIHHNPPPRYRTAHGHVAYSIVLESVDDVGYEIDILADNVRKEVTKITADFQSLLT